MPRKSVTFAGPKPHSPLERKKNDEDIDDQRPAKRPRREEHARINIGSEEHELDSNMLKLLLLHSIKGKKVELLESLAKDKRTTKILEDILEKEPSIDSDMQIGIKQIVQPAFKKAVYGLKETAKKLIETSPSQSNNIEIEFDQLIQQSEPLAIMAAIKQLNTERKKYLTEDKKNGNECIVAKKAHLAYRYQRAADTLEARYNNLVDRKQPATHSTTDYGHLDETLNPEVNILVDHLKVYLLFLEPSNNP